MIFSSSLTAFGLLALSVASPVELEERQIRARTPVSQELYDAFIFYGRYAPTYPEAPCMIPPEGTVVQGFANADPATEMTLFRDDARQELIMAFPGTAGLQDLLTDINKILVPYITPGVNCPACRVHRGVLRSWNAIQPQAKQVIDAALAEFPNYRFKIVGHSLGGALTKFAYASFVSQGYNVGAAYSYGEFRTGNRAFADFVDRLSGNTDNNQGPYYRITHAADGVPQVLPTFLGYRHSRSEYWFLRGADGPSSTFRCFGQEPSDCNNSQLGIGVLGINPDHIFYPGVNVLGCGFFPGFSPATPAEVLAVVDVLA